MDALSKIEGEIMECAFYDLPEDTAMTRAGWGDVRDAIEQARAEGAREALAGVPEVVREVVRDGALMVDDYAVRAAAGGRDTREKSLRTDAAKLRAWLATLPPHDATGTLEVGHG